MAKLKVFHHSSLFKTKTSLDGKVMKIDGYKILKRKYCLALQHNINEQSL